MLPYHSNHNGAAVGPGASYYPPGSYPDGRRYGYAMPPSSSNNWPQSANGASSGNPQSAPTSEPSSEVQQQTVTIRNAVNIQKGTIRLEKDEESPGFYLLAFSFDADSEGSFSIFLFAKEGTDCSLMPLNPNIFKPVRLPFDKGFGQKFRQAPGTGVYLDAFEARDLEKEGPDEVCPLVIRAQTAANESNQDYSNSEEEPIGAPLPKSVNSQITQAVIVRKGDGDCKVRVMRQIIWVNGIRYELQEIYGIESAASGNEYDESDFGKECVICLSEPRDTAVMPCRHMCMCNGCASVLKSQMNRCPICRQHVDTLLQIKV